MSSLGEFLLRGVIIVAVVDNLLLRPWVAKSVTLDVLAEFFLNLVLAWSSSLSLNGKRVRSRLCFADDGGGGLVSRLRELFLR